jgi:hypothetical protein
MPHRDPKAHREYVHSWLNDPAHPERLEAKRQRDRAYYQQKREERLAYQAKYYRDNKESVTARNRRYKQEVNALIFEAKSRPCEECGNEYPPKAMELHHIDPSTKVSEVCQMSTPNQARKELAKCRVLCAICHRLTH